MTQDNFKRAGEIMCELSRINDAVKVVDRVDTSENRSFYFGDDISNHYFSSDLIDQLAKDGCKALILSNLEGKKKKLEAEFEKL